NVISVGARQHTEEEVLEMILTFLETPFSGSERHVRRIDMISDYES
ncbi:MAG: RpiB/LacA/LacB family sugar-phosphate isomerase, partial [Actinomycetaceae bacterium]|nr:RpiB/LacA/LacB family sugar-phosphate isomerase [Actinomycetaceae bacterium]